jgi:hypothetical protein
MLPGINSRLFPPPPRCVLTATKLSGVTEMVSMPALTSSLANSGLFDGAWPQSPTLAPVVGRATCLDHPDHRRIGSLNSSDSSPESRSTPSVSWVRSFEPMEKPSKRSANSSARMTLDGISS